MWGEKMTGLLQDNQASRDNWIEAPTLTAEELVGSCWTFGDAAGNMFSRFLTLAPDGMVGNFFDGGADFWQVVNGRLCFIGKNGLPSVIFHVARAEGSSLVALAGKTFVNGAEAVCVLNATSHPAHPIAPSPANIERRANFLKAPQADKRRANLVVVSADSASRHDRWLDGAETAGRSWDICVAWRGAERPEAAAPIDYIAHLPNRSKFQAIFDLFYPGSPLWAYDRIWLPNDQVVVSAPELNQLFHLAAKYGLDMCQPSLRAGSGSHINHPVTVQQDNSEVRFVPFVEIVCPMFTKRALKICIGSFKDAVSGYGLDHLWQSFLGRPPLKTGIFDAVSVVNLDRSAEFFDATDAVAEEEALFKAYGFARPKVNGVL